MTRRDPAAAGPPQRSSGERRRRGPRLLLLVYAASLVLLALTNVALIWIVSQHLTTTAVRSALVSDAAVIATFIEDTLERGDLDPGLSPSRAAALATALNEVAHAHGIREITLYTPDGSVLVSTRPQGRDSAPSSRPDFMAAAAGEPSASLVDDEDTAGSAAADIDAPGTLLHEYLPIAADGEVAAIFELERDAGPLSAQLEVTIRDVVIVTVTAGLVLSVLLLLVFRAAQNRLDRQTEALVESTRRDTLTGLLNHGAAVGVLTEAIEASRHDGSGVAVALVDIDNFRLLNEVHGHAAGDRVLLDVAGLLTDELGSEVTIGRYGPDEFVVVAPRSTAEALHQRMEAVRARSGELALQFGGSEHLPVTISAAVASYPANARSATELLSTTAVTLREAKGGGGDLVVATRSSFEEQRVAELGPFRVLHSLVLAVDTKDRYTRRHSEDVSRYAVFLAERLGESPELIDTLRVAGLLHDVGKIGVPDSVLRKPDKLTDDEYAAMQQHVALGDLLVRDLPNLDIVRAAIRHHHERWDGAGYLDRLAGDGIPYVARILSVGDTFSAMTTSRPYRKALSVETALERLRNAAGTQLDPELTRTFVEAMETDPQAPMPSTDRAVVQGWSAPEAAF